MGVPWKEIAAEVEAELVAKLQAAATQNAGVLPPEGIPLALHYLTHVQEQGMTPEEYQAQFPLHCKRLSAMLEAAQGAPRQ